MITIELNSPELLADKLDAMVSAEWPLSEYDKDAMDFFLSWFEKGGDAVQGWYAINIDSKTGNRALVGSGGYFGPLDSDGIVEIGYSVIPERQRQGYASEIVKSLINRAFTFENVTKIKAHTISDNLASTGVLNKCDFIDVGIGEDQEHTCFELVR